MVSPGAFGERCPRAMCSVQRRQRLGGCSDTSRQDLAGLEYQSPCRYIFETGAEEKVSIGGSDAPGLRRGDFPRVRAPETWSLMLTLLGMFCHLQQLCELFLAEPGTERTMCSWGGPISFKVPSAFLPSLVSGENQEGPTALSCREETPV